MSQAAAPRTVARREQAFAALCDRLLAERGPREPAWTTTLRRQARERFEEIGWPSRRHEEWLYTDLTPLRKTSFTLAAAPPASDREELASLLAPWRLGSVAAAEVVFVNGRFDAALSRIDSMPEGIRLERLADALEKKAVDLQPLLGDEATWRHHAPGALNTACMQDGILLEAAPRRTLERPVQILFVTHGGDQAVASFPRLLISAAAAASLSLVETHLGFTGPGRMAATRRADGPHSGTSPGLVSTLCDPLGEVFLGPGATVAHDKVIAESATGLHLATLRAVLDRDASYTGRLFSLGGRLVRNDIEVLLADQGARAELTGLYVTRGEEQADIHTTVDHRRPHGDSHQLYKGVLADRSRAAFSGKILVRPDAQKTNATQACRNLLLSADAEVDAKPQLEIYADDVKCTHGATVGQLDAEALFYLRSRGIRREHAEKMLIHGFMNEIVATMGETSLQSQVERALAGALDEPAGA